MQLADVASGQGQTVDKKLFFMSPEWLDAVHHAAAEADRLDLEMAIFSSAGWSLTGGPWVKPEQAMKKLVWSETIVNGPVTYSAKLPAPPSIEGPIRDLSRGARVSESDPRFYKDCFESPFTLKKIGDYWFAQGINRFVFHTSAHQPLDTKPGNTMVGTHINRNITWAEQANPFMTYLARNSLLVLPNTTRMTLPVLKKINELVREGATVVGARPENTPGYSGYPDAEKVFTALVSETWGDLDGISRTRRVYGKGKVIWGNPVKIVLIMAGIQPDLEYGKPLDSGIDWIHRRSAEADIYFIVNSSDTPLETSVRFRVSGMEAEIWDPATGKISQAGYSFKGNRTTVSLNLSGRQSAFIVFRKVTDITERIVPANKPLSVLTVEGPWEISFPPGLGAPEKIIMDTLKSFTLSKDEGVKYFSGTAVYKNSFKVPKVMLQKDLKLVLDLGKVGDIAEVTINGSPVGILWNSPFCTDISGLIRKGTNIIEIKVTNEWTNRLAGDMKAAPGKKILNSPLFACLRFERIGAYGSC
jgi:hypothetical protein